MTATVALEVTCLVNEARKLYRELTRVRRSHQLANEAITLRLLRSMRRYFTIWNNVQIASVVFLLVGTAGHAFSDSDSDILAGAAGHGCILMTGCDGSGGSERESSSGALLVQSCGAAGVALKLLGNLPGSA